MRVHIWRVLLLVAIIVGWEWLGQVTGRLYFAPLSVVVPAIVTSSESGRLPEAIAVSLLDLLGGYIPAVIVGVIVGSVAGRNQLADATMKPYVTGLLVTPLVALTPLILFTFGIGSGARMATVFLFAVGQIIASTSAAVRSTPEGLIDMARVFESGSARTFRYVIFPAAIPGIFSGLRLGLGAAFVGMIVAQFLISAAGIGGLLVFYSARFRMDSLLGVVLVIAVFASVLNLLLAAIERRAVPENAEPVTEY